MASDEELRKLQRQLAAITDGLARATGEVETVLFKDFAVKYLEEKGNNTELRESTKRAFEQQVRKNLIPDFGHLPLRGTQWRSEFNKWVKKTRKKNEGNAKPHIRRFFNARKDLGELLLAAFNGGMIETKVSLDNPDEKRETGRWVTRTEVVRLLWKARRPFRIVFMAFFRMGCRPREILSWEWSMLRKDDKGRTWINVPARITKTGRSRTIPMNPRLAYILRLRERRGNSSLFIFPKNGNNDLPRFSYHDAWNRARDRAGLQHTVPYDMRRSIISQWAKDGVQISYAAKLLDSSPQMLQEIYTKFDSETMAEIIS